MVLPYREQSPLSWHNRPRQSTGPLHIVSEEELMNRVIRTKARIVLAGRQTLTLNTEAGVFEITPKLAKILLREAKPRPSNGKRLLKRE
jgi:hypothetical protein